MPLIPVSEEPYAPYPRVLPEGQLAPQRIEASPADFGAQVGQTLTGASQQEIQLAVQQQNFNNETAVNDVINNKFFPAFNKLYQQYYALQGKDAGEQLSNYQQSMLGLVKEFRGGLSNGPQQHMFDQQTARQLHYEFSAMERQADAQNRVWRAQTTQATVDRYISGAADKYNDPGALSNGVASIATTWSKYGIASGLSPEYMRDLQQKSWDKLYQTVIERQAIDPSMGPEVANKTFQQAVKNRFISGGMQLEIARSLRSRLQLADAGRFVDGLLGAGPSAQIGPGKDSSPAGWTVPTGKTVPQIAANLSAAIALKESGNQPNAPNRDANGLPGRFQFQKSTWQSMSSAYNKAMNKADGALEPTDANELAVAQWQIGEWLKEGFSPAQIASRWNSGHADWAGRTGVNDAAQNYDVPGYVGGVMNYYEHLNGVEAPMAANASGAMAPVSPGGPVMVAPATPSIGGWSVDALNAAMPGWEKEIAEKYPDNWLAQHEAMSVLRSRVSAQIAALKQQSYTDEKALWQALADPKGAATLTEAMKTPGFAAAWGRLYQSNPQVLFGFEKQFAEKQALRSREAAAPTQQDRDLYFQLSGQAITDPYKFADMSLANVHLPFRLLNEIHTLQDKVKLGISAQEAKNSTMEGAMAAAKYPLQIAGIDPKKNAAEYKQFIGRLDRSLAEFENANKRGPKTPELNDMISSLLAQVTVPGQYWGNTTERAFQLSPGDERRAIMPQGLVPAYTARFRQKYGRNPLPAELNSIYFALTLHPQDAALQAQIDSQIRDNTKLLQRGQQPAAFGNPAAEKTPYSARALEEFTRPLLTPGLIREGQDMWDLAIKPPIYQVERGVRPAARDLQDEAERADVGALRLLSGPGQIDNWFNGLGNWLDAPTRPRRQKDHDEDY